MGARAYTQRELDYIDNNAGHTLYKVIGKRLGRSQGGIKNVIPRHGLTNDHGYLTIVEIVREYHTFTYRVRKLLAEGRIQGRRRGRGEWIISPDEITPEIEAYLRAPKQRWRTSEWKDPDYNKKYGMTQYLCDGKRYRIPAIWRTKYTREEINEMVRKVRNQDELNAVTTLFGRKKWNKIKLLAEYYELMPEQILEKVIDSGIEALNKERVQSSKAQDKERQFRRATLIGTH